MCTRGYYYYYQFTTREGTVQKASLYKVPSKIQIQLLKHNVTQKQYNTKNYI